MSSQVPSSSKVIPIGDNDTVIPICDNDTVIPIRDKRHCDTNSWLFVIRDTVIPFFDFCDNDTVILMMWLSLIPTIETKKTHKKKNTIQISGYHNWYACNWASNDL